jgi:hypothetical protein
MAEQDSRAIDKLAMRTGRLNENRGNMFFSSENQFSVFSFQFSVLGEIRTEN